MHDTNRKQLESLLGLTSRRSKVAIVVVGALALLVSPILSLVSGACIGVIAGWVFPDTLGIVSTALVGKVLPYWQLGAGLGFVAGFFRSSTITQK